MIGNPLHGSRAHFGSQPCPTPPFDTFLKIPDPAGTLASFKTL